jgi:hypothetical protein
VIALGCGFIGMASPAFPSSTPVVQDGQSLTQSGQYVFDLHHRLKPQVVSSICDKASRKDAYTYSSHEYRGARLALLKKHPRRHSVLSLPKPGYETVRACKRAYWLANPNKYQRMRQESAAGRWYQSPRAWLWYKVNSHECWNTWDCNTGNGYYGGLQMDRAFQRTYNPLAYQLWGTADNWPIGAQMLAADRAYGSRGLNPWPSSQRAYGSWPASP